MSPSVMKIQILITNLAKNPRTSYATLTVKGVVNVANMTTSISFTARKKTQFSLV